MDVCMDGCMDGYPYMDGRICMDACMERLYVVCTVGAGSESTSQEYKSTK